MKKSTTHEKLYTLIVSPHRIVGALITPAFKKGHLFSVKEYTALRLDNLELEHLRLFNPSRIAQLFDTWYLPHYPTPLAIALYGPALHEQFIATHHAHPRLHQLPLSHAPHRSWHYRYIYSHDTLHYFYACALAQATLFQFQLLTITHQAPLQLLTSERMALFALYKKLFGAAFRTAHFADALQKNNNVIENCFTKEDSMRCLHIPPSITIEPKDTIALLAGCGLNTLYGELS